MTQDTIGHAQDDVANTKGQVKRKARKKANHSGLPGDEKIGGKWKEKVGQAG